MILLVRLLMILLLFKVKMDSSNLDLALQKICLQAFKDIVFEVG